MTATGVRKKVIDAVDEAVDAGACRSKACDVMNIAPSTLRRWKPGNEVLGDRRPTAIKPVPPHRLSPAERKRILAVCNGADYQNLPPSQIVPQLADKGEYIASESSFYRVLKANNQLQHRGRAKARQSRKQTTHIANRPNEVWMWDITYLPSRVIGQHFYLYMIEDLHSRYGVHFEVHEPESGELAATLMVQAMLKAGCKNQRPVLHSDNGAPMKSLTMKAKLAQLGIKPSYSRPRVSNDNAFIESMFRTVKYCPQWPSQGFDDVANARQWVASFMQWYNETHRHRGIRYVTPGQRYRGEDVQILEKRKAIYQHAKQTNPNRWSGNIRNWTPCQAVALNPEKDIRLIVQ